MCKFDSCLKEYTREDFFKKFKAICNYCFHWKYRIDYCSFNRNGTWKDMGVYKPHRYFVEDSLYYAKIRCDVYKFDYNNEKIKEFLREKRNVEVLFKNERYYVKVENINFNFERFEELRDAENYCEFYGLKIVKYVFGDENDN